MFILSSIEEANILSINFNEDTSWSEMTIFLDQNIIKATRTNKASIKKQREMTIEMKCYQSWF